MTSSPETRVSPTEDEVRAIAWLQLVATLDGQQAVRESALITQQVIEALRARVAALENQLRDTEVAFWCVLSAAGGEMTVSRPVAIARPSKAVLERTDDPISGAVTWRAATVLEETKE